MFLAELGKALVLQHIEDRATNAAGLPAGTIRSIENMLNRPVGLHRATAVTAGTGARKCAICIQYGYGKGYKQAKANANKVKQCCNECKKPVCRKHSVERNNCKN